VSRQRTCRGRQRNFHTHHRVSKIPSDPLERRRSPESTELLHNCHPAIAIGFFPFHLRWHITPPLQKPCGSSQRCATHQSRNQLRQMTIADRGNHCRGREIMRECNLMSSRRSASTQQRPLLMVPRRTATDQAHQVEGSQAPLKLYSKSKSGVSSQVSCMLTAAPSKCKTPAQLRLTVHAYCSGEPKSWQVPRELERPVRIAQRRKSNILLQINPNPNLFRARRFECCARMPPASTVPGRPSFILLQLRH